VGLTRNYLGVHYPSDVLAAYAVTSPLVIAIVYAHRCAMGKPPDTVVEGAIAEAQEGR
jgi:membrane-associated phospholipid phosphatase